MKCASHSCWKSCDCSCAKLKAIAKFYLLAAVLASLVLFVGHTETALGEQTVRLATLTWSPYMGQTLTNEGYAAELIRTAFERSGYQVKFFYMPWQRAVKTVTEGSYDGLCPIYYTKQRADDFSLSKEFPAGPLVFLKRKEATITYNRLEDLKPYKIAVVRGYANTKAFDDAEYLQKSHANSDQTGYRRLLFGSVDLWLADKFVAQATMSGHLPERAGEIEFVDKPLGVKNLHVAFSKMKPDHQKLTKAFDRGLAQVLSDGTIEKILANHGLSLN